MTTIRILSAVLAAAFAAPSLDAQEGAYPSSRHGGNYMYNYYLPPAPSSTPWAPAWSPDGLRVAVAMSGSIWSVDPATGVASQLTHGPKYHSSPAWSPDGRWLVYTADDGGTTIQLEILDTATGRSHPLTEDDFLYADPVFSPDGTRLAYVSNRPSGYFNVHVRPVAEGRWAGPEVAVTSDNDFGRNRLYFGPWDMHITPAWMPGGDELLLVSNRNVALGSGNVLRVPARQGGIREAHTVLEEQTLYRTRPDVSPDGKRFVYSSTRGAADQYNNLYVQPTVGGEPYKLTFFEHDAFHPRWSPDGEWIAFVSNEGGLPELELLESYGGARRRVEIRERRWRVPVGRLAVEVRSGPGGPSPARIHLTAADGKFHAPSDAYARVGERAGDRVFHTSGRFELDLPAGPVELTVVNGFEVHPRTVTATVEAGGRTALVVELERMEDMGARGWFSGSTHVHMNYGGNLHNSLENLMMMSAAEDQDVVNEQVANKDNRVLDHQYFLPGGGPHPLSTPDRIVVVGQEYRPPFYGHVFMLGLRDHLISPFTTGYEGTAIESLYPSNTDMLRKARAQGATVGYVHPWFSDSDPLEGDLGGGKGFMVDAALAATDAVEWTVSSRGGFFPLYAVWSNGLRVTAVGGEDSISDLHRSALVGAARTYVRTPDGRLTMEGWFEGLRAGHAFVTTGPLVELTVAGRTPGESIELPAGGGEVEVRVRVRSVTPLERVWLVRDGEEVADIALAEGGRGADFVASIPFARSGWIHLRAEGAPTDRFPLDSSFAQAFTNPVWVTVGGAPIRSVAAADYGIAWIDRLAGMAREWPGWRSRREIDHVLGQFQEARAVYEDLRREALAEGGGRP